MNQVHSWRRMALRLGAGVLAATIASAGFVFPPQAAQAAPGDIAVVPDTALRKCINHALDYKRPVDSEITTQELASLKNLLCPGLGIQKLDGLEHATSLEMLRLSSNLIANVAPLSGLNNLRVVDLYLNLIIDVSPLHNLNNLTYLDLHKNQIVNVDPLSALNNLTYLDLHKNRIINVTPLSHMTEMDALFLNFNKVTDLSALSNMTKLREASVEGQRVTLPGVAIGEYFNPLVGPNGPLRVLEASNPSDLVSRASDPAYAWRTGGSKTGSWDTNVVIGSANIPFSGTFAQQVSGVPPVVKHTVKFNLGGHGTPITDVVVNEGAKVPRPKNPTATGWTFEGWYTNATFSTVYNFNTAVTADMTLYAKWSKAAQPKAPCSVPRRTPVFVDVLTSHKFYTEIDWMQCMKYSTGYSDKTYRPAGNLSREAMAAFIFRLRAPKHYIAPKVSPFTDVPTSHKFYKEIAWTQTSGLSTGYADGTYRPSDNLSREAMAAFIYRLEGKGSGKTPTKAPFVDVPTTQKFAKEIAWMKAKKLTTGYADGTYRPKGNLSREAMAAFIYRLVVKYRR